MNVTFSCSETTSNKKEERFRTFKRFRKKRCYVGNDQTGEMHWLSHLCMYSTLVLNIDLFNNAIYKAYACFKNVQFTNISQHLFKPNTIELNAKISSEKLF